VGGGGGVACDTYLSNNRNTPSIRAVLRAGVGGAVGGARARDADVLVENFAPGTMQRWGLGYATLASENPGLVYCSITGYGSEGPDARRPGYDFAVQARSGWMSITGETGGEPMKVGVALVDVLTGQNAAIAVLAALRERDRSGRGQRIEVALLDSALAGLVNVGQAALTGADTPRYGNAHATIVPYQTFAASDRALVVAVGNDAQWRRLCAVLEMSALADDPRFATNPRRVTNRAALVPLLAERIRTRAAAEWIDRLEAASVPCALVRSPAEALGDPAVRDRGGIWRMRGDYGEVEVVASPLHLTRTPARLTRPAPALGENDGEGWRNREK
jgi:crotonobetainyl-CoA:carnitine CoA-transferase CaiB-like acyl-CoA transferase